MNWHLLISFLVVSLIPTGKKKNEGVSGGIHGYCVQDIQKIMEYGFLKVVVVFVL